MRQGSLLIFLAALTCAALPQSTNNTKPGNFDPKPWLEDFQQILAAMSSHYADLEWAVEDRKMDLPGLRRDTEAKLRDAVDENGARRILDKFFASFGDGHLEIRWPKNDLSSNHAVDAAQSVCSRMGYRNTLQAGLDFSGMADFAPLETPEAKIFPGGLLRLNHQGVIGIIRIGLFSEHGYAETCEQASRDLQLAEDATCDDKCDDELELATANLLTSALSRRAAALRSAGATRLLIDITHNGGGSDWVEAASRALSPVPLRDSKMAFIKHEHWTRNLQDRLRDVQVDISSHANSPIPLHEAATTLESAIEASRQPCDRMAVWDSGKLRCSLLVKDLLFTSGIVAYAKPGSLGSLESRTSLFLPSRYSYPENSKGLPLTVVVDRNTWSSAEYFAAILQDNHAASIVGEVTGGAGCGYTNGGIPVKLKNSGAQLKMPDCIRFRTDGSNEVDGITPDIILPWSAHDSDFQHAKKLVDALRSNQRFLQRQPAN
jgi:peptidase S41-like protein